MPKSKRGRIVRNPNRPAEPQSNVKPDDITPEEVTPEEVNSEEVQAREPSPEIETPVTEEVAQPESAPENELHDDASPEEPSEEPEETAAEPEETPIEETEEPEEQPAETEAGSEEENPEGAEEQPEEPLEETEEITAETEEQPVETEAGSEEENPEEAEEQSEEPSEETEETAAEPEETPIEETEATEPEEQPAEETEAGSEEENPEGTEEQPEGPFEETEEITAEPEEQPAETEEAEPESFEEVYRRIYGKPYEEPSQEAEPFEPEPEEQPQPPIRSIEQLSAYAEPEEQNAPGTATVKAPSKQKVAGIASKTTLNLCMKEKSSISPLYFIAILILILVLAAVIGYFGVYKRYEALNAAQEQTQVLKDKRDALKDRITQFQQNGIEEEYHKFIYEDYDGTLADRLDILELLERDIFSIARVSTLQVTGNTVRLSLTGLTLDQISELVKSLRAEQVIENCFVYTTSSQNEEFPTASLTIIFKDATKVNQGGN